MSQCWIASIDALVPSTVMSRSRAPYDAVPAPSTSGVTRRMRVLRVNASVSSSVNSRAVSPTSKPCTLPPPDVSARPGSTISSSVPSCEN